MIYPSGDPDQPITIATQVGGVLHTVSVKLVKAAALQALLSHLIQAEIEKCSQS